MAKLSEDRKNKLNAQKRRAIMKDIDEREALEEKQRTLLPYRGVSAKQALRKSSKQNTKDAFRDSDGTDLEARIGAVNDGEFRDLLNIERYGDDAMRSRAFGSPASNKQNFSDGGSVRGVKSIQTSGTGFSGTF